MRQVVAALILLASITSALGQASADRIPSRSQIEDLDQSLGAADSSKARPLDRLALSLIKDYEGWVPQSYNDPAGYCTIGYGHLIALRLCTDAELAMTLTEAQGIELLETDTVSARLAVQRYVQIDLTNEQFGALASFTFNVGKENFRTSTLLKLVNAGQVDLASRQFGRWVRAGGKVLDGLISRRQCEAALFLGQLKERNGRFDRSLCQPLGAAVSSEPLIDVEVGEK